MGIEGPIGSREGSTDESSTPRDSRKVFESHTLWKIGLPWTCTIAALSNLKGESMTSQHKTCSYDALQKYIQWFCTASLSVKIRQAECVRLRHTFDSQLLILTQSLQDIVQLAPDIFHPFTLCLRISTVVYLEGHSGFSSKVVRALDRCINTYCRDTASIFGNWCRPITSRWQQ